MIFDIDFLRFGFQKEIFEDLERFQHLKIANMRHDRRKRKRSVVNDCQHRHRDIILIIVKRNVLGVIEGLMIFTR